ncbi:MAG: hypothetical protein AAF657_13610 [Acidobacteriota bacterium]
MLDSLFTWLFKYRPVVFETGDFAFALAQRWLVVLLVLAGLVATVVVYSSQRERLGSRRLAILTGQRAVTLVILALALLRPVLRVSTAVPGESFLAVLIDDSRSMRLEDEGRLARGARALEALAAPTSRLRSGLQDRFTLRYYRFSDVAERFNPAQSLELAGHTTDLAAALDHVRQDLAGIPLAGMVLVTDGATRNASTADVGSSGNRGSPADLSESLLQLTSHGIPVYTVGLGEERYARDIELSRLSGPRRVLQGSAFAVDVLIEQRGYDGETVRLVVEEGGGIAATREVTFERGEVGSTVRVNLEAEEPGARRYRFAVEVQPGEHVEENNARSLLLAVEERREKILYFEGEPRWEVKFLRRALAEDEQLQLVVLQRTAKNKYLRLGVDGPLELASAFPKTREELFAYRGLILGTVEAEYFTASQHRILEEFVSQRGGGMLFLGGRHSFAEGGYAGKPLENVLPVVLEPAASADYVRQVAVAPTAAGEAHSALQLAESVEASRLHWHNLPSLSIRNPLHRLKPGANLLLSGRSDAEASDDLVVLASQRYGRGRAVAFPVQDSWLWQMHADIPLEDRTHERLWQQLLRWLIGAVPGQVELELPRNQVAPGEEIVLRAAVRDAGYLGLNGARVVATVTDPTGAEQTVPLDWTLEEDGDYRGVFVPPQVGSYEVRIDAEHEGEVVGSDTAPLIAADLDSELFDAEMDAPLLRRIAEETGGRFYTGDNVGGLAEDARFTTSGKTVVESYDLWDMPIVFLLLLGWLASEWLLRRRWGLA